MSEYILRLHPLLTTADLNSLDLTLKDYKAPVKTAFLGIVRVCGDSIGVLVKEWIILTKLCDIISRSSSAHQVLPRIENGFRNYPRFRNYDS